MSDSFSGETGHLAGCRWGKTGTALAPACRRRGHASVHTRTGGLAGSDKTCLSKFKTNFVINIPPLKCLKINKRTVPNKPRTLWKIGRKKIDVPVRLFGTSE